MYNKESGYYPPGAEFDSRAPYNQVDAESVNMTQYFSPENFTEGFAEFIQANTGNINLNANSTNFFTSQLCQAETWCDAFEKWLTYTICEYIGLNGWNDDLNPEIESLTWRFTEGRKEGSYFSELRVWVCWFQDDDPQRHADEYEAHCDELHDRMRDEGF